VFVSAPAPNKAKTYDTTHARQINATPVRSSRVVKPANVTQQNHLSIFVSVRSLLVRDIANT